MVSLPTLADLRVILIAGLTCGILDVTCTGTLNQLRGIEPLRTLQGVLSGVPTFLSDASKADKRNTK